METVMKADIFFVVTTVVVVVVGVLFSILLVQAIRTASIVKKTLKSGSEYIEEIKNDLKKQGALATLISMFIPKKKKNK
jgi:5-bromo-4-chloroindolyl phosphate hydrolysis protein